MVISPIKSNTSSISPQDVITALKKSFPEARITFTDWSKQKADPTALYDINIDMASEPTIIISCLPPGNGFGVDAWDEQCARVAVAIRNAWNTNDRIVAVGDDGGWYVDLVPGMTPDGVMNNRQPFSALRG